MDIIKFIDEITKGYSNELRLNNKSLYSTVQEMQKAYGQTNLGSTTSFKDNSVDMFQSDRDINTAKEVEEKNGNKLGINLNKYLEKIINFTSYRESQEENYFFGVNKNLRKISKVLIMSPETEKRLLDELQIKGQYFVEMSKVLLKEILLEQVEIDDELDNPDFLEQTAEKDLEFFKENNDYSKVPITTKENLRSQLNHFKSLESSTVTTKVL